MVAVAAVRCLDDSPQSWLAAWATDSRPHPDACQVDPAVIDPTGPAASVSLVCPVARRRPVFDDPSVVQAIRRVALVPHLMAVTTLTTDPVHFAGSLLATDPAMVAAWPGWWSVDPFVRLGLRRRLLVEPGLLADRVACSDRGPSAAPAHPGRHSGDTSAVRANFEWTVDKSGDGRLREKPDGEIGDRDASCAPES